MFLVNLQFILIKQNILGNISQEKYAILVNIDKDKDKDKVIVFPFGISAK